MSAGNSTPFQVNIDLVWIPYPHRGSTAGRLLVRRTVSHPERGGGPSTPAVTEYWISDVVDESAILQAEAPEKSLPWQRLMRGEPVDVIPSPVPLYPLIESNVDGLGDVIGFTADAPSGVLSRPLFDISARIRPGRDGLTMVDARVGQVIADVLSHPLDSLVRPALAGLTRIVRGPHVDQLGGAPDEHLPNRLSQLDVDIRSDLAGRIEFTDSRGVQVGLHNLQVNRFVAEAPYPKIDFEEVLSLESVRTAIEDLQQNPTDAGLRDRLVGALADQGLFFHSAPQHLVVGPRYGPFEQFLRDLLVFDVLGLQVGDYGTQHNVFTYLVTGTPTGADLLRGNKDLAMALANCLCPVGGAGSDVASLQAKLQSALGGLPVDWNDGRNRGIKLGLPDRGRVLRVSHTDGVMIGSGTQAQTLEEPDFELPDISGLSTPVHKRRSILPPPPYPPSPTEPRRGDVSGPSPWSP